MRIAWVDNVNTNVCGVDWSDLANENYFQAALLNTHIAGRVVANFVNFISYALGISASNVTIAGHSLGAHVAGFVGKDLKRFSNQQLGHIIGLDPAGPLFTFPLLAPPENILTADDASFVQVVHTSVFTFGAYNRLGNADFYANNAIIQPGCFAPLNPGTLQFGNIRHKIRTTASLALKLLFVLAPFLCSHYRATAYFQASLNATNPFVGTTCATESPDILDILGIRAPRCARPLTDLFGIYSRRVPGRFYLPTTDSYPYCIGCSP